MTGEPVWLERALVIAVHERNIAEHGGRAGIRDSELLDSALARPRNLFAYGNPSLGELAAAYAFGIVRNHPFLDGNKRTAFVAAVVFLLRNGLDLTAGEASATAAMMDLAASRISEAEFAQWLADNTTVRP
jgi:death-on-curing protein